VTDDPYRTGHSLRCPRCQESLAVGDGSFVCMRDCGEWLPVEAMTTLGLDPQLGQPDPRPKFVPIAAPKCLVCARELEARYWITALFLRCAAHGFWIDARQRAGFHKQITAAVDEEREVQQLTDRLAYPEGRREIAVRLRALERRVELLERKS
jgi:hypothetical protein